MLRCNRLADLVNAMDPKLVAAAFGTNPEGAMFYLADHVDPSPASGSPYQGRATQPGAVCSPLRAAISP
jgi:hypothetical protein